MSSPKGREYRAEAMLRDPPVTPTRTAFLAGLAAAGAFLGGASPALAQQQIPGTPYIAFGETRAFSPLANGTQAVNTQTYYQNYSADVPLPFPFKFYNQTSSMVTIGPGAVFMEGSGFSSQYYPSTSWLGTNSPNAWVAPYWTYLEYSNPADGALYEVLGRAPTRRFVIEWRNARGGITDNGNLNYQVALHEGISGRIDVHYAGTNTDPGYAYAIMGMEDPEGNGRVSFGATGGCQYNCPFSELSGRNGQLLTMVQDPGVELVSLGLEVPQFATLGVPFMVPVSIANAHRNAIGPFDVRVLASRDRDGSSPIELGRTTLLAQPFQVISTNIAVNPMVSLGEQSYYLWLEVDSENTVTEVDERNNLYRGTQVRFLPSRPDLVIDAVRLSRRAVNAGDSLEVYVTATNAGSEAVSATELAVMLSSNPVISANDGVLATTNLSLDAGESTTATVTVTIQAQTNSGAYYIGALADREGLVSEINEANNGLAALYPLEVSGGTVAILTQSMPAAILGETFTALLRATGGSGKYSWTVTQGQLPAGLGLVRGSGEFFGRPNTLGCESFTVQVADAEDTTLVDTQMLQLCVVKLSEPLTVVTRDVPPGVTGQEYTFQLIATGGDSEAEKTWTAMGLPQGMEVTTGGLLIGTAPDAGAYPIDVEVSDGTDTAARTISLDIDANGNLQIAVEPLPHGKVGEPFPDFTFTSNGGIEPISWILVELQDIGLDLDTDGRLYGTPTRAGRFRLQIEARDSGPPGFAARDQNSYELVIEDDGNLEIYTTQLPTAVVGLGYDRAIAATGGLPEYSWSWQGRIPEGLELSEDTSTNELRIIGVPEEDTEVTLLVTVRDREGRKASRAFALIVAPEAPATPAPGTGKDTDGCSATSTQASGLGSMASLLLLGLALAFRRRR